MLLTAFIQEGGIGLDWRVVAALSLGISRMLVPLDVTGSRLSPGTVIVAPSAYWAPKMEIPAEITFIEAGPSTSNDSPSDMVTFIRYIIGCGT